MVNKKTVLILLIFILILGSFLRIYKLGDESFWFDESAIMYVTRQNALDIIMDIYTTTRLAPEYFETGGTPPLYYVLANYWTKLIGLNEFKLRLLSALFGIISIYMIFLIGKMVFDYRVGLVSAFILSINYMHIYYSQEARAYSLIILLTLLIVYFLLNALKQNKALYWIAYVSCSTMLIYTHYFGFFILFFEFLFLLIFFKEYRKYSKSIIISAISIFVLYLPWMPALLRQISAKNYLSFYLKDNIIWATAKIFVQFNSWFTPDLQTRIALRDIYHSIKNYSVSKLFDVTLLGWLTIVCVLAITALLSWYFFSLLFLKNKKLSIENFKEKNYLFILMWFLVPILIPIAITLAEPASPVFGFVQYVLFATPAYYLIVAKGILKSKRYLIILLLLFVLSILPLYSYYSNFDKQQWREASFYFKNNRLEGELIVTSAFHSVLPLGYYYKDMEKVIGIRNVDELMLKAANEDSVWLLYASEAYFDPEGTLKKYLDEEYKLDKKVEFTGIKIFKYLKKES